MRLFASLMAGIGSLLAGASSNACVFLAWDEPICPKNLVK